MIFHLLLVLQNYYFLPKFILRLWWQIRVLLVHVQCLESFSSFTCPRLTVLSSSIFFCAQHSLPRMPDQASRLISYFLIFKFNVFRSLSSIALSSIFHLDKFIANFQQCELNHRYYEWWYNTYVLIPVSEDDIHSAFSDSSFSVPSGLQFQQ